MTFARRAPYLRAVPLRIEVNGQPKDFPAPLTVRELVEHLGLAGRPVAVEVNRRLVKRADHGATVLAEGDRLEVVTLVGGG